MNEDAVMHNNIVHCMYTDQLDVKIGEQQYWLAWLSYVHQDRQWYSRLDILIIQKFHF